MTIMPKPAAAIEQTLLVAMYDNALVVLPSDNHVTTSTENVLNVVKLINIRNERKKSDSLYDQTMLLSKVLCHATYLPQKLFV